MIYSKGTPVEVLLILSGLLAIGAYAVGYVMGLRKQRPLYER
jgi:hypothetical protein